MSRSDRDPRHYRKGQVFEVHYVLGIEYRRRYSLSDREGVRHLALCPNDDDAWWTPIACGGGISLPGTQTRRPVTCPECIAMRKVAA